MAESREQRAESREQRAESREQRAENCSNRGSECQSAIGNSGCKLHNGKRRSWNLQVPQNELRCCYCNYKKVFKIDVQIAKTILARDYKGFGSGLIFSNGVLVRI